MNIDKITTDINNFGFTTIPSIFDQKTLDSLNFLNNKTPKSREGQFPVFFKQFIIKALKFDYKKINQSFHLKRIAKSLKFEEISDRFFESKSELNQIDSYFTEKSQNEILPWHNDLGLTKKKLNNFLAIDSFYNSAEATILDKKTKVSPRGLKFFIYLTDVKSNNGSLSIIPSSNKIVKAITKLILEKKIPLVSYWSLQDLRNVMLNFEFKEHILKEIGIEKYNNFIDQTNFIDKENLNVTQYDIEMKKGSIVIFDELCIHRGSAPKNNPRIVLRYLYGKKII
tara:strand:+ start:89 stop:937 length:849 start_codon:yes stop_codon:yes gene_type:complete